MTDHPVIFSGPMVRALLGDQKTQTRRLASSPLAKCKPGDRLWVRENFTPQTNCTDGLIILYEASRTRGGSEAKALVEVPSDGSADKILHRLNIQRPSIHMPRWASRLTLIVTDVRRQRLRDITNHDAFAEGVRYSMPEIKDVIGRGNNETRPGFVHLFRDLWDSLHGHKPGESWDDNPEIVALTFTAHQINIDQKGQP